MSLHPHHRHAGPPRDLDQVDDALGRRLHGAEVEAELAERPLIVGGPLGVGHDQRNAGIDRSDQ